MPLATLPVGLERWIVSLWDGLYQNLIESSHLEIDVEGYEEVERPRLYMFLQSSARCLHVNLLRRNQKDNRPITHLPHFEFLCHPFR